MRCLGCLPSAHACLGTQHLAQKVVLQLFAHSACLCFCTKELVQLLFLPRVHPHVRCVLHVDCVQIEKV